MIWRIKEFFIGLSNFWKFRKEVFRYRSYEHEGSLDLLSKGLLLLAKGIKEDDASVNRDETVSDILKSVYCLKCMTNTVLVAEIQSKCEEDVSEEQVKQEALRNLCRILREGDKGSGGIRHWRV